MNKRFRQILRALPDKPPRSRLEPYRELIQELRRRGRTYREISGLLMTEWEVRVTPSGVHDFVRRRIPAGPEKTLTPMAKRERKATSSLVAAASGENPISEVQSRIAVLKARVPLKETDSGGFKFDPYEPLRLSPDSGARK